MAPRRSLLRNAQQFQLLMKRLGAQSERAVTAMWERTDGWRDVEATFPNVVDPFLAASAQLTAQWYHDLAPDRPFEVRIPDLPPAEQLVSDVKFAYSTDDPLSALVGAADRHIFTTSRETVWSNARRERVRYVRLAEPDACAWCQMVASAIDKNYASEESASFGHTNCNCTGVPVRGDEDWTAPAYQRDWVAEYKEAKGAEGTTNLDDLANYVRRKNYDDVKDAYNARRRDLYAQRNADSGDED